MLIHVALPITADPAVAKVPYLQGQPPPLPPVPRRKGGTSWTAAQLRFLAWRMDIVVDD